MLKLRIIPVMLWSGIGLIKGRKFDHSRKVGSPVSATRVYRARDIDELVLLDVAATLGHVSPRTDEIRSLANECDFPLTVGGGVTTEENIEQLFAVGADKVSLNSVCYSRPELVTSASRRFGRQSIVVSVDYRDTSEGLQCFSHAGTQPTGINLLEWVREMEARGAGELILCNCDYDGMMSGYDIENLSRVALAVSIPVIALGGAGNLQHFVEVVRMTQVSAVAAGSVFHFTDITPQEIKRELQLHGVPVRKSAVA